MCQGWLGIPSFSIGELREYLGAAIVARGIGWRQHAPCHALRQVKWPARKVGAAALFPPFAAARPAVPTLRIDVRADAAIDVADTVPGSDHTRPREKGRARRHIIACGAGAVRQAAVQEYETGIAFGHGARLHQVAAARWIGAVADRPDFGFFEQGGAVVAPDEIHIACNKAAVEPGIALDLDGVLLTEEIDLIGDEAALAAEVEHFRLRANGPAAPGGVGQGQRIEAQQVGVFDQENRAATGGAGSKR